MIEQSDRKPDIFVRTARRAGGIIGEVQFYRERTKQTLQGLIFDAKFLISPFATTKFTVSDSFGIFKGGIEKAVRSSSLPEGVKIISPLDEYPSEGEKFVVVTSAPDVEEARDAFAHGALDYVSQSMNPKDLQQSFDRRKIYKI